MTLNYFIVTIIFFMILMNIRTKARENKKNKNTENVNQEKFTISSSGIDKNQVNHNYENNKRENYYDFFGALYFGYPKQKLVGRPAFKKENEFTQMSKEIDEYADEYFVKGQTEKFFLRKKLLSTINNKNKNTSRSIYNDKLLDHLHNKVIYKYDNKHPEVYFSKLPSGAKIPYKFYDRPIDKKPISSMHDTRKIK